MFEKTASVIEKVQKLSVKGKERKKNEHVKYVWSYKLVLQTNTFVTVKTPQNDIPYLFKVFRVISSTASRSFIQKNLSINTPNGISVTSKSAI